MTAERPAPERHHRGRGRNDQAAVAVDSQPPAQVVELSTLKDMGVTELTKIAKQLDVPGSSGMRKQELIFEILRSRAERQRAMKAFEAVFQTPATAVSAETGEGLEDLWKLIDRLANNSSNR